MSGGATDGVALLRARIEGRAARLREALAAPDPPAPFDPHAVRRIVTTGIGSSAGHARFLAHVLSEELGLPARFVSTGALAAPPPPGTLRDALIVFSQGLSPNARFAFSHAERYGAACLVTAQAHSRSDDARTTWLRALEQRGVVRVDVDAPDEFGTLVRVVGPMLGYASALALARSLAHAAGLPGAALSPDPVRLLERVASAPARAVAAFEAKRSSPPAASSPGPAGVGLGEHRDADVAFVAGDGYGELVHNLSTKLLEGMLRPAPPIWDGLELAHGGLQQLWSGRALLIHLARAGRPVDDEIARALAATLEPARHTAVRLEAEDEGPAAVFEHEAMLDALLVRWLEERGADPARWPAAGRDGPLYDRTPALADAPAPIAGGLAPVARLERMTWPAFETAAARAPMTAVVALGSVEQHGPHLPLGTDAWIADALAGRVAAGLGDAMALPAVALGSASEHAAFAGTLSLEPATLEALLRDLLASVARAGFADAFVFSAHGGNLGVLRAAGPALREAAAPARLVILDDHRALSERLAAHGSASGVTSGEQGQHAGELETSILLGLDPGTVVRDELRRGRIVASGDAQGLFYPSLRDHVPEGVLGDPSRADALRAGPYLEAWADALVAFYRARASE